MRLYEKIIIESKSVNDFWQDKSDHNFTKIKINFGKYFLKVYESFELNNFPLNSFFLVDKNLHFAPGNFMLLEPSESKTKDIDFIEKLIVERKENFEGKTIVAVGGGVILDTALCIANFLKLKIILVPTTVLSMSDSSIGSKARANKIVGGKFKKHFYRANYDPSEIVVCENFLESIPVERVLNSSAEIIKTAFFQSESLLQFLLSENFDPFRNKSSLMKAILWTADLKRVCMEVDPNESLEGGRLIIREGHNFADKLEQESGFTVSHGEAVLMGIKKDLEVSEDKKRIEQFAKICDKLRVNN